MANWDFGELARAAGAEVRHEGELPKSVEAVGTDSRSLPPSSVFVALRGERFDGHQFVKTAVDGGAIAVVVDAAGDDDALAVPRLVVEDTLRGLGDIAGWVRREHNKPVLAVTGSNGKTTTKELCAAALSGRGVVHKTAGNLNNLIGVPLTLFAWPDDAWAGVIEMGMNVPGEIARLTEIAAPNVALITNVAGAHLEGLGSIEAVGDAKGELFAQLAPGATAIVNADDPMIAARAVPKLGGQPRLSFGRSAGSDVRVVSHRVTATGLSAELEVQGVETTLELNLVGAHNALNAAAAIAAGLAMGEQLSSMVAGLARATVPGGRLRVLRNLPAGFRVVDDTYNANPESMRAAFMTLGELASGAARIAVLGDMFELGPDADSLHRDTGAAAAQAGVQTVFALGDHAASVAAGAQAAGAESAAFASLEELLDALDASVSADSWILVKGSRGMKMERVVQHLQNQPAKRGEG